MADTRRDEALDCTKGIAIFAVVLFHVTRGFTAAGQLPESFASRFADAFAYGFHVPIFFLIAGYLAFPRADDGRYQVRRLLSFYYTYLLWSLASWMLSQMFAQAVNNPVGWRELAWVPVVPIQHFWFILPLMAGTAALSFLRTSMSLLSAAALCIGLIYALPVVHAGGVQGALAIYFVSMPFIFIGAWLRRTGSPPLVTLPAALTALVGYTAAIWWITSNGEPPTMVLALPIILTGCYAAYAAGSFATHQPVLGRVLTTLGRHSYTIYLAHVIAAAGTRIMFARLLPGLDVVIALSLSFAAGLVLPILLERTARKWGVSVLIGLDPLPVGVGSARKEAPAA